MRDAHWWATLLKVMLAAVGWPGMICAAAADSPVIVNSGSTNTAGFRIAVDSDGTCEYTPVPRGRFQQGEAPMKRKLPADLVRRFYSDVEAARPLSDLPRPRCMKSVSFGTRLTIQLANDETPDLSCGDGHSTKLGALIQDANQIVALFNTR